MHNFFREMNFLWTSDLQLQNFEQGQQFSAGFPNFPLQDGGAEGFPGGGLPDIHSGMLLRETTGHYTQQGSHSGLPGDNGVTAGCNKILLQGSGSGLPGENEVKPGCNIIWEQGSGSGLPQVHNWETDTPTAVAPKPGKKRNGKGAEYSKNHRDKKRKLEEGMKLEIEKLRKENEELRKNSRESNTKLDDLQVRIRQGNDRYIKLEEEYRRQQIQVDSLTKSLENMSYLQEENTRLKSENDSLTQQLNADTEGERLGKKWVKIPLANRYVKIKGNVLHLKRLD